MRSLGKSAFIALIAFYFSSDQCLTNGSVVHTQGSAARYGVQLESDETYDPWMGFKMSTSLQPEINDSSQVFALVKRMEQDNDPCARLAARFIERDRISVQFVRIQGFNDQPVEAGYDYDENIININSAKPYLRNSQNLRKKLIHESFHRVQHILGLINDSSDFHKYEHRPIILRYLQEQFPQEARCELPEVPEGIRGTVADTVQIPPPDAEKHVEDGSVDISIPPNYSFDSPKKTPVHESDLPSMTNKGKITPPSLLDNVPNFDQGNAPHSIPSPPQGK